MARGWIGVDLDGTLAHYDRWRGHAHIGAPIPEMVERIRKWIEDGWPVKIFTARVSGHPDEVHEIREAIKAWLAKNDLPDLEVTCIKDYAMVELYDDRAVTVEMNTGQLLAPSSRGLS